MKVIPKRNFLVRQEDLEGGKKKDIHARRGVRMEMSDKEVIKFWGALDLPEADKKRLSTIARTQGHKRLV